MPLSTRLLQLALRLVFWTLAAVALLSLLAVSLVLLVLSLLRYLVTGQKPAPWMAFSRFREFSAKGMPRMWPGADHVHDRPQSPASPVSNRRGRAPDNARLSAGDVVDVEVREIPPGPKP